MVLRRIRTHIKLGLSGQLPYFWSYINKTAWMGGTVSQNSVSRSASKKGSCKIGEPS